MATQLPGSSSGKNVGLSAVKAALRLVGGSDLANVIADLTGLSARRITSLAQVGSQRLQLSGQVAHEYRDVPGSSYSAMESAVVSAFKRAVERDADAVPIGALTGIDDLVNYVTDATFLTEKSEWSQDEAAYADALTREVAGQCRTWYLEEPTARAFATAVGMGNVMKGQQELVSMLRQHIGAPSRPVQMDAAVEALEQRLNEVDWTWAPASTGSASGLDGFMTPTDEAGKHVPFQIPVRLLRSHVREGDRGMLLGPMVSRDDVELLRAYVPRGYLITYSDQDDSLHFTTADIAAAQFKNGTKRHTRLRMMRSDVVTATTLGRIGRDTWTGWKRLVEVSAAPAQREAAVRLYQTLSSAQSVFFEFLATLAFVDPGNLMFVHHQWAQAMEAEGHDANAYLEGVASTVEEYEITPPIELLMNFPAPSLLLTVMRAVIDQLDEIGTSLDPNQQGFTDQLGVPGLRATIASAIERSYRTMNGAPLQVTTPAHEDPSWLVVNAGHYFVSVAQVALVVNRLVHSVRQIVLPPVQGSENIVPFPVWIRR